MHQQLAAAGNRSAQSQQAGGWGLAEVQVAIRVVFDNQSLVLDGHLQHLKASLSTEQSPAGVAKCGDQVDKLGLVLCDQFFQLVGFDAMAVDWGADQLGPVQTKALDGGQKSRPFDDHLVAGTDHGLANQIQGLLAAGGHNQMFGGNIFGALFRHEMGQLFAQGAKAFGGTVLQGRTGVLRQSCIAGFTDAFYVKHGAVRKATGKTDDAGLAQELEKLTDGGGFNVVQAVSKMQGGRVGHGVSFRLSWPTFCQLPNVT